MALLGYLSIYLEKDFFIQNFIVLDRYYLRLLQDFDAVHLCERLGVYNFTICRT